MAKRKKAKKQKNSKKNLRKYSNRKSTKPSKKKAINDEPVLSATDILPQKRINSRILRLIFFVFENLIYVWFPAVAFLIYMLASGNWSLAKFAVALFTWIFILFALFLGNNVLIDWNNGYSMRDAVNNNLSSHKMACALFGGGILIICLSIFLWIASIPFGQSVWYLCIAGIAAGILMIKLGMKNI